MGQNQRGDVVQVHQVSQHLGQAQEGVGSADVDGHPGDGLGEGSVNAFPLDAALIVGGEAAVVECGVHRAGEPEPLEDLRQHGRESEPAAAEHRRARVEVLLVRIHSGAQVMQDRLGRKQRQRPLGGFPADDRRGVSFQLRFQQFQCLRFPPRHLFDHFARDQQVVRCVAGQFVPQRLPQSRPRHQRQVEQTSFDRVEVLTGLVQQIEGRLESLARRVAVSGQCVLGRGKYLRLKRFFIEIAHIAQLASEHFNQEMGESQCEEIGDQVRLDAGWAFVELLQRQGDHLLAMLHVANDTRTRTLGLLQPLLRKQRLARTGYDDQVSGRLLWRPFGGKPTRHLLGTSQQRRVPQCGPCREQLLGIVRVALEWEILQAHAGKKDDELI